MFASPCYSGNRRANLTAGALALDIGGNNGVSIGSGGGGLSVSVGGASGVNASLGLGVNGVNSATSVGGRSPRWARGWQNAHFGGSSGLNANVRATIGGRSNLAKIGTTVSVGGKRGLPADVDAMVSANTLATYKANVATGGNTLLHLILALPSSGVDKGPGSGEQDLAVTRQRSGIAMS